jgi:hypothetical protein
LLIGPPDFRGLATAESCITLHEEIVQEAELIRSKEIDTIGYLKDF